MSEEIALALADLKATQELWQSLKSITKENERLAAELNAARVEIAARLRELGGDSEEGEQPMRAIERSVIQATRAYRTAVTTLDGISAAEQALWAALDAYDAAENARIE